MHSTVFTEDELARLTTCFKQGTPWHSWSHRRDDRGDDIILVVDERPREQPLRIIKTAAGLYAACGPRMGDLVVADEIEQLIDFLATHTRRKI